MMVTLVLALATITFNELDAVVFYRWTLVREYAVGANNSICSLILLISVTQLSGYRCAV